MERWFRDQWVFSILILLGVAIISTAEVVQRGADLLASVGLVKEKTLQLATENAKGELSRKLTNLAWRRLFWSKNYMEKARLNRPQPELDYSWNKHLDTVADWSSDYMVNLNGMEEFYPNSDKKSQFQSIQEEFRELEDSLVDLRTKELSPMAKTEMLEAIKSKTAALNTDLYFFVVNHKEP